MSLTERVNELLAPALVELKLDLYDLEFVGGTLRVTVDSEDGVNLDQVAELTKRVSHELDLHDPIGQRYTLEVTSPGLERKLRTQRHWESAVGERVSLKLRAGIDGARRMSGVVERADKESVDLRVDEGATGVADDEPMTIQLRDITSARTVFDWEAETGAAAASKQVNEQNQKSEAS